jgi:ATP-binding cassette subfamily B protein
LEFPHYKQLDANDCGPTSVRIISKYYGRNISVNDLRSKSFISRDGVSMLGISESAEAVGFRTLGTKISFDKLKDEAPLPCVVHWNQNHFVVVYKIKKDKVYISDPAAGLITLSRKDFERSWLSSVENFANTSEASQSSENSSLENYHSQLLGVALLMEPTSAFYEYENTDPNNQKTGLNYLLSYLFTYKRFIFQLAIGLLLGSTIQLIFPFLTQAVVDIGINTHNLNFIYIVLVGQLMLTFSRASVEFIRSWVLIHLSTRINISIISDFLIKLMQLPMSFFDQKTTGDILRRIEDHSRIERFLSSSSLNILFSFFNLIVFGVVLVFYNATVFLIMMVGSCLYIGYILLFMKKRKEYDYLRFTQTSQNESNLIQLVQGMQEIKLNNYEREKRWEWERIQAKIFRLTLGTTRLQQWQDAGSILINETKNVLVTIMTAHAVLEGHMTVGMMLSVQYIIGQVNGPINQFVGFVREYQDAKLSLERIGEIRSLEAEDQFIKYEGLTARLSNNISGIRISNLFFQYEGARSPRVLDGINTLIAKGKVTAIVGSSGSGKTTLMKILLKFYPLPTGLVEIDGIELNTIHASAWRSKCGVVMQDGFIFADTIANNVTLGDQNINQENLSHALHIANIMDFVQSLPLGKNTKIGGAGTGISQGQKQRILIARAVYKNPEYVFLDEATSSLDASNEKVIMQNLDEFYKNRTVVVIAHRLSTVKNADSIIVLDKGKIIEQGTHVQLTKLKGAYFELIKNQLELGG